MKNINLLDNFLLIFLILFLILVNTIAICNFSCKQINKNNKINKTNEIKEILIKK